jgi:hypothetical protein
LAKKNWHLPLKKRQKNSGTRFAPKFLMRFLFSVSVLLASEKKTKEN